jgi:hypothetical protein
MAKRQPCFIADAMMTISVPVTTAKPSAENKCAHDHIRPPRHRELKFGKQALPEKSKKFSIEVPARWRARWDD